MYDAAADRFSLNFSCWLTDNGVALFATAASPRAQKKVLYVSADGNGVWDITPHSSFGQAV